MTWLTTLIYDLTNVVQTTRDIPQYYYGLHRTVEVKGTVHLKLLVPKTKQKKLCSSTGTSNWITVPLSSDLHVWKKSRGERVSEEVAEFSCSALLY